MFENEQGHLVIRLGDTTDHGGKVITAEQKWTLCGRPIARIGDHVICPLCDNKIYEIVEGDEKIALFGQPAAFEGHRTSCGARLISSLAHNSMTKQKQTAVDEGNNKPVDLKEGTLTTDGSNLNYISTLNNQAVKPSDLLKLDERAILMRYREAINYMNKYNLRFQGFAPDTMLGYGLADGIWNDFRSNDYFPGMFTGGKYYRCRPQSEVVVDFLHDLDLNYEWIFNFAVAKSAITGNESHTWVEALSPIGSTVIHMDPLYDKVRFPMYPHPKDSISATSFYYLNINVYRDNKIDGFQWEYKGDRFQSGQKLRERKIP